MHCGIAENLPCGCSRRHIGNQPLQRKNGKPAALAERRLQNQSHPESRQGIKEKKKKRRDPVISGIREHSGENPHRNRQQIRQQNRHDIESQRNRKTLQNQFTDRSSLVDCGGSAEIAVQDDLFHPKVKSDRSGLVKMQFFAQGIVSHECGFFRGKPCPVALRSEHGTSGRISRRNPQQQIADKEDYEQSQPGEKEPFCQITV